MTNARAPELSLVLSWGGPARFAQFLAAPAGFCAIDPRGSAEGRPRGEEALYCVLDSRFLSLKTKEYFGVVVSKLKVWN